MINRYTGAYDDARPVTPEPKSAVLPRGGDGKSVADVRAAALTRRTPRAALTREPAQVVRVEQLAAHARCARKRGRATALRPVTVPGVCALCGKGGRRVVWMVEILKGAK